MELILVSEVMNEYSNKYVRVRRRVTEDGLILLYRYKTYFECSENKKGKLIKSDDKRKVRKEYKNYIFYR